MSVLNSQSAVMDEEELEKLVIIEEISQNITGLPQGLLNTLSCKSIAFANMHWCPKDFKLIYNT